MSRLIACLLLLSGSLHAAELDPLVPPEGLTISSSSQAPNRSVADSELLPTVFEDAEPSPVTDAQPAGTICYEDYCQQCDCRTWTARVGFLAWRPDEDNENGGGGFGGLSGTLDYDTGYGPYLDLIYHTDSADLEFIYFSVYDWSSGVQFGPLFNFTREAELDNYEFNIKKEVFPGIRLLTGIRVVTLDSIGSLNIPAAMPPATVGISADNELIGWQVGIENVWYRRGPFSVDTTWKGGIYHNDIEAGFVVPGAGALTIEQGDTSFLTDFWFNLNYQLTDNLALRGGYSLMYIDPVATVGGEGLLGGGINPDDDIFIHGLQMMLEVGI